jgi:6-pyruvoyltetrahydropterin/6-carboxytetrahydropterin synthase
MKYRSTKTYGHNMGLSACFRQWKAESHCKLLHGYALEFSFVFGANELDERNWVIDFGSLGQLKNYLVTMFDHKLILAEDDPHLEHLEDLQKKGLARVVVLPRVGCEAFAEIGWKMAQATLHNLGQLNRVKVLSCEVREHGANSAIYTQD